MNKAHVTLVSFLLSTCFLLGCSKDSDDDPAPSKPISFQLDGISFTTSNYSKSTSGNTGTCYGFNMSGSDEVVISFLDTTGTWPITDSTFGGIRYTDNAGIQFRAASGTITISVNTDALFAMDFEGELYNSDSSEVKVLTNGKARI